MAFARTARRGLARTRGPRCEHSFGKSGAAAVKRYRRLGGRENRLGNYARLCLWRTSEATLTPAILRQIEDAHWTRRLSGNAPLSEPFHDARWRKTLENFVSSPRPLVS